MPSHVDIVPGQVPRSNLENSIIGVTHFLKMNIPKRQLIMSPWLKESTLAMIYAPRGIGKTFLGLSIALAITRKASISTWTVDNPAGCLYIDGEMSAEEMQDRIKRLSEKMPDESEPLRLYSADLKSSKGETSLSLSNKEGRDEIYEYLKLNSEIKVLILDNIAALTPGISENEKAEWDFINQWLLSLRFLGVAVIFFHHAGKKGLQRGTSGREDALDVVIKLERPKKYKPEDGACFKVVFEKSRGVAGDEVSEMVLKIVETKDGSLSWESSSIDESKKDLIIRMLGNGVPQKDIPKAVDCTKQNVGYHKKWAVDKGFLNHDGTYTKKGEQEYGLLVSN
jgi:KaiC/GvpD/RAD55 family RecA-like ATPase